MNEEDESRAERDHDECGPTGGAWPAHPAESQHEPEDRRRLVPAERVRLAFECARAVPNRQLGVPVADATDELTVATSLRDRAKDTGRVLEDAALDGVGRAPHEAEPR